MKDYRLSRAETVLLIRAALGGLAGYSPVAPDTLDAATLRLKLGQLAEGVESRPKENEIGTIIRLHP